jgi:EmrB/QacA subfamily drug resistance transporter
MLPRLRFAAADRRHAVVALTGAALFMIVLDNLIVLSTWPSIERDLHASLTSLEWIVDAYILSFAVLMLTAAAIGERFGRRRVFTWGLLVFSAASAVAGFAGSPAVLISARIVQGVGAAVLMPLTLTLLSAAYPPERRAGALGLWSAIAALGVALGPIAGGLLASSLSWHWIFWVNVPVGVVVAALAPRVLEESRGRQEPLDHLGLVLATGGLLGVVWATVRGNVAGWGAPETIGAYAAGIVLLIAFVRQEQRTPHPMLPLRLFADRTFSVGSVVAFLLHFAMFGAFFMLVQYLAQVRGQGPVMSGVWSLPWTAMPLFAAPLGGRLGRTYHPARVAAVGVASVTVGLAGLAPLIDTGADPVALIVPLWLVGTGIGLTLPNIVGLAMASAAPEDLGKASGTLSTARQLGSVFGIAVPVAIFQLAGSYGSATSTSHALATALVAATAAALAGLALTLSLVPGVRLTARRLATAAARA